MRFRNSVPPLLALALGGGGPEVPAPEASAASVLRVVGEVGAGLRRNGSGVMVAPGGVATRAHVVAGARSIS